MSPLENRQWVLRRPVKGLISEADFEKRTAPVPALKDGEILLKTRFLSFDPAQRTWLNRGSYMKQIEVGDVMKAQGLMTVVASNNPKYRVGDLATGMCGWQEYVVATGRRDDDVGLRKLPPFPAALKDVSPMVWLSCLGTTGLTAYFGLLKVGDVRRGDVVLVSGAAGATGSVVGQIAKIKGASKVIGIAGGKAKCDYCVRELGYDACIDYRDTSRPLQAAMREACPKGVDVFFDNVGGETLEAALALIRPKARVVLCGGISQYNTPQAGQRGPRTYLNLVTKMARMEGFLVFEFAKDFPQGVRDLMQWYAEGRLTQRHDVRTGFDNIPSTLQGLYTSSNFGKLLLALDAGDAAKL